MTGWRRSRQELRNALPAIPLFALLRSFFFIPLLSTLWNSFFGWSFDFGKYAAVISEPVNFRILAGTLKVGLLVTMASLAVAYPLAYQMTKVGPRMFSIVSALVLIPLFTAFLIRTYAWIVILGRQGIVNNALIWLGVIDQPLTILNTTVAVVIGMTHVFVPMAVFTIYSGMVRIDRSMLRAASALGAHPVQAFTRVYFPLTLPSVLSAGVLIFVVAIGFYITPSLLGGPSDTMISQLVVVQMNTMLDFEMGLRALHRAARHHAGDHSPGGTGHTPRNHLVRRLAERFEGAPRADRSGQVTADPVGAAFPGPVRGRGWRLSAGKSAGARAGVLARPLCRRGAHLPGGAAAGHRDSFVQRVAFRGLPAAGLFAAMVGEALRGA